jgi:hypothetical protein
MLRARLHHKYQCKQVLGPRALVQSTPASCIPSCFFLHVDRRHGAGEKNIMALFLQLPVNNCIAPLVCDPSNYINFKYILVTSNTLPYLNVLFEGCHTTSSHTQNRALQCCLAVTGK